MDNFKVKVLEKPVKTLENYTIKVVEGKSNGKS